MENKIESNNSIGMTSRNVLVPSPSQFFLYFLISFLLLIALNIKNAWDYLNQIVLKPQGGLDSIIADKAPGVHNILTSLSQSILLQVIFWVFVGCVVYIIIWFVKNIAINLLNDITADQYIHPSSYKRGKFWGGIFARRIFFWINAAILVVYLAVSARMFVYLADLCYDSVTDFATVQSSLQIVGSLLAATSAIYICVLLVHVTMNSWQLMYKDL
jgi:hypothetical protein